MFIISVVLIAGVAAGIAWPFLQRQRAKAEAGIPATATDVIQSTHATEQLCPHCSKMNSGSRSVCVECGNPLAAQDFGALMGSVEKQEMVREMAQLGILFLAMVAAMCLSNWLPTSGKVAVLLLTVCVLAYRGWKQLMD